MKMTGFKKMLITWWKPLVGVAGFAVMIVYAGGILHEKTPPDHLSIERGEPLPDQALIIDVKRQPYPSRISITGTTESDQRVQVSARIGTTVKETMVTAGDRVTRNQLLMVMDDRELQEQLTVAEAELQRAETEFNRITRLLEKDAATRQQLTGAESAFTATRAHVEKIRVMLTYTRVTSPIEGRVADRFVESGDFAGPGQPLLSIYNPAVIRLEAPVPVRLIEKFTPGAIMSIELEYPAGWYTGVVSEIVGEINPASRTQLVKLTMDAKSAQILPGTFGRIWVESDPIPGIRIPQSAIIRVGQLEMVQLVQDGRIIRRLVKTGSVIGDQVEILSGLSDGDRIAARS